MIEDSEDNVALVSIYSQIKLEKKFILEQIDEVAGRAIPNVI